jgi:RNA ligase-like protein
MVKEFKEFPKMARFQREIVITEKIDGTNASIDITAVEADEFPTDPNILFTMGGFNVRAGSRTKWVTPGKNDNAGWAGWVFANAAEIVKLGEGTHFGEYWGKGIQRGYGLNEKRFSLFNTHRWSSDELRPKCCHVVPVLYTGPFDTFEINEALLMLKLGGSVAAPGFLKPEGIVIFHTAGNFGLKLTIEKDEIPKSLVK